MKSFKAKVRCILPYVFESFPNKHYIVVGEVLEVLGYLKGNPVLQMDSKKHPSDYIHLKHCCGRIPMETMNKHFEAVEEEALTS